MSISNIFTKAEYENEKDFTVSINQTKSVTHMVFEELKPILLQYIDLYVNNDLAIRKELCIVVYKSKRVCTKDYLKKLLLKMLRTISSIDLVTIRDITATDKAYVITLNYIEQYTTCFFCNRLYTKQALTDIGAKHPMLVCSMCLKEKD